MTTTTNLADFGYSEIKELSRIKNAWIKDGLPEDFGRDEVHPMFNKNSGYVFLTNSDYECCMMNGDDLETWYHCGECGHEGFKEDCTLNSRGCNECNPDDEEEV